MKKFTCREMGGPCGTEFEGETMDEVVRKGGQHIMTTTDEGHKLTRGQMANSNKDDQGKWREWFKGIWDTK